MSLVADYSDSESDEQPPKVEKPANTGKVVRDKGKLRLVLPAASDSVPVPAKPTPNQPTSSSAGLSFLPAPKHAPAPPKTNSEPIVKKEPVAKKPLPTALPSDDDDDDDDDDDQGAGLFGSFSGPSGANGIAAEDAEALEDQPELGPARPPEGAEAYMQANQPAQESFEYIDWVDKSKKQKGSHRSRQREQVPDPSQMLEVRAADFTAHLSEEYKREQELISEYQKQAGEAPVQAKIFNRNGGEMTMCSQASRTAKRKHQIHTLAMQAKQKEAELQIRGMKYRKTKAETYGRYGW